MNISPTSRRFDLPSARDLLSRQSTSSSRQIVQWVAVALLGSGLLFTGVLNFELFAHGLPATVWALAIVPTMLIEGSIAVFIAGSYLWFASGTQSSLGKFFGWSLFAIVVFNSILGFNLENKSFESSFLKLYSMWGLPLTVVLIVAMWKAIFDCDPRIDRVRESRQVEDVLEKLKTEAYLSAVSSPEFQEAIIASAQSRANDRMLELLGVSGTPDEMPEIQIGTSWTSKKSGKPVVIESISAGQATLRDPSDPQAPKKTITASLLPKYYSSNGVHS